MNVRMRLLALLSLCGGLAACASQIPLREPLQNAPPKIAAPVPAPVTTPPASSAPPPVDMRETQTVEHTKAELLQTWTAQQARLYRVAAPLLINNTELCPRQTRMLLGFTAKTKYSYSNEFLSVAQSVLGLEDRLKVFNVLPGSGASVAGVQEGDVLLAVEIEPLPQGEHAETAAASIIASELAGRSQVALAIERNGERMSLTVPLTLSCAMIVDLGNTDAMASLADGHRIMITKGMLNFVRSDEELAYVLAQEIARNVEMPEPHNDVGHLIDQLHTLHTDMSPTEPAKPIATLSPLRDTTENELALYMLVRAGYNISNAAPFWGRLQGAFPAPAERRGAVYNPEIADPLTRIRQTVSTIAMKQKKSLPLVP